MTPSTQSPGESATIELSKKVGELNPPGEGELIARLRKYMRSDHVRGCDGRFYACSCGYDQEGSDLHGLSADIIERLTERLARMEEELAGPMEINVNDQVWVQITGTGIAALRANLDRLNETCGGLLGEFVPPEQDSEGWSRMQLWNVMQELGSSITMFGPNRGCAGRCRLPRQCRGPCRAHDRQRGERCR